MKNISQAKLVDLKLPIAPVALQVVFQERISMVRGLSYKTYRASQLARQTFQSLMAGVFG